MKGVIKKGGGFKHSRLSDEKKEVLGNPKRINFNVDARTHKRLKMAAVRQGTTITELMNRMIMEYLEKEEKNEQE